MKFRTEILPEALPFRIGHDNRLILLGSCFTTSIGAFLQRYLFHTTINPFGTIYNPLSVARNLEALLDKENYTETDLYHYDKHWLSFDHYTQFSHSRQDLLLQKINSAFVPAARALKESDRLLITFGTAWVYRLKESGEIVCNCHKVPADRFERFRLEIPAIVERYKVLINRLTAANPDLRIIFTVSPVRHWKDGAHGNQLSKAILLLAIDELVSLYPDRCCYLPAYELLLDDLRDYRFYTGDLLHPSEEAVNYIWEKFSETVLNNESRAFIKKLDPLLKTLSHRPSDPEDPNYTGMIERVRQQIRQLKKEYPGAEWDELDRA